MKGLLFLLILLGLSVDMQACDQCSISVGGGIIAEGHFIGTRMRYRRQFKSVNLKKSSPGSRHLEHILSGGDIKELYYSYEVYGNYKLNDHWHVQASIPMVNNYRSINETSQADVYGLGDIWTLLRYQTRIEREHSKLTFSIGAGAKFPTGSTDVKSDDLLLDLDVQPGTGSTDYLLSGQFIYQLGRFYFVSSQTMKLCTEGSTDYRYGNSLASTNQLVYQVLRNESETFNLNIMAGPYLELLGRDATNEVKGEDMSQTLYLDLGTQIQWKQMRFILSVQEPISFNLDIQQLPTTDKLLVGLQYDF